LRIGLDVVPWIGKANGQTPRLTRTHSCCVWVVLQSFLLDIMYFIYECVSRLCVAVDLLVVLTGDIYLYKY